MTPETGEKNTLHNLLASVQLKDVRLMEGQAKTRIRDPRGVAKPRLVLSHVARVIERGPDGFIVGAAMQAFIVADEEKPSDAAPVFVKVLLALLYNVDDAARFGDDVLGEFARVNASFNAWPYWREYIQSTVSRMQLPPLTLPVFRIGTEPHRERDETGRPAGEGSKKPAAPTAKSKSKRPSRTSKLRPKP